MDTSNYNPLAWAQDPVWLEWVAAMYESYAADNEAQEVLRTPAHTTFRAYSLDSYRHTAQMVAEQIEDATEEFLNEDWDDVVPNAGSAS